MLLNIWIVGSSKENAARLIRAWRDQTGGRARFIFLPDAGAACEKLSALLHQDPHGKAPESLPDLLVVFGQPSDTVTDLLSRLRRQVCADVLFVTEDHSAIAFARALQLGVCDYLFWPCPDRRLRLSAAGYLARRRFLKSTPQLSQALSDRFLRQGPAACEKGPSKALGTLDETGVRMLLYAASQDQGVSAASAARYFGISRVCARKYLNLLAEDHWLQKISPSGGHVGRPRVYYEFRPLS